jgi:hypothetical protein
MNMSKIKNPMNSRHLEHNAGQDHNVARRGSVQKRSNDGVAIHSGMTSLQRGGAGIGGMSHPVAAISDGGQTVATSAAAQPMPHAYGALPDSKSGKTVPATPGMRSRNAPHSNDLGEAILRQAYGESAPDDCQAHGRNTDGSRKC